jgi:hypothetical protein
MKSMTSSLVLAGMLLMAQAVFAIDASQFREEGRIESIDKASLTLVVDDSSYPLTPYSRIYSPTGRPLSFDALRSGSRIKFNLTMPQGSRRPVIREVLILPAN